MLGKVDGELIAFVGFNFFEKLVHLFFCQNDRQKAVFVAVIEEDVGKAGGNDGAEAVVVQCPRACSREEPQPKFLRVNRICAP